MPANSISSWANIHSGERFVYSGKTVAVKSEWSLAERLTGRLHLSSNLERIQAYLKKHPETIQAASHKDLRTFKQSIRRIEQKYYQTHWRIYIWIFEWILGKSVHSLCDQIVEQVKPEIQKRKRQLLTDLRKAENIVEIMNQDLSQGLQILKNGPLVKDVIEEEKPLPPADLQIDIQDELLQIPEELPIDEEEPFVEGMIEKEESPEDDVIEKEEPAEDGIEEEPLPPAVPLQPKIQADPPQVQEVGVLDHILAKARDLKEKMKDPDVDGLSFKEYLSSLLNGKSYHELQTLAEAFLPLMEEKDWLLFRDLWNVNQVSPYCTTFVSYLFIAMKDPADVQESFTQLLDDQADYKGIYRQIHNLIELDATGETGQAVIRGYFASPLYRKIGFDTFIEHSSSQIKGVIPKWAQEVNDCNQRIELYKAIPFLTSDGELRKLVQPFGLADLLLSYTEQKARNEANNRALELSERALRLFFKDKQNQQNELSQMCAGLSVDSLAHLANYLLTSSLFETAELSKKLLQNACDEPDGLIAQALAQLLANTKGPEFNLICKNMMNKFLGWKNDNFICFYERIIPANKCKAFLEQCDMRNTDLFIAPILTQLLKDRFIDAAADLATVYFPENREIDPLLVVNLAFDEEGAHQAIFHRLFIYALKSLSRLPEDQMKQLEEKVPLEERGLVLDNLRIPFCLEFFFSMIWEEGQDQAVEQAQLAKKIVRQYEIATDANRPYLSIDQYIDQQKWDDPVYRQALVTLTEEMVNSPNAVLQDNYLSSLFHKLNRMGKTLAFIEELSPATYPIVFKYIGAKAKIEYWLSLPDDKMKDEWENLQLAQQDNWHSNLDEILRNKPPAVALKLLTKVQIPGILEYLWGRYFDRGLTLQRADLLADCLNFSFPDEIAYFSVLFSSIKYQGMFSACIPLMSFTQLRVLYKNYEDNDHYRDDRPLPVIDRYFMDVLFERSYASYTNETKLIATLTNFRKDGIQNFRPLTLEKFKEFNEENNHPNLGGSLRLSPTHVYFTFGVDLLQHINNKEHIKEYIRETPFDRLRMAWPVMPPEIRKLVLECVDEEKQAILENYCFERLIFARLNTVEKIREFIANLDPIAKGKLFGRTLDMFQQTLINFWKELTPESTRAAFARYTWSVDQLKTILRESSVEQKFAFEDLLTSEQKAMLRDEPDEDNL